MYWSEHTYNVKGDASLAAKLMASVPFNSMSKSIFFIIFNERLSLFVIYIIHI